MRLPVEWIKEYVETSADARSIATSLTMAGLEVEEETESVIGSVLDIKVTPNRGDCLSIKGIARELAAALDIPMTDRSIPQRISEFNGEFAQIRIEATNLCSVYVARKVNNVKVGPSPGWMQDRLTAAGMRPINNIVDITNYVMLETGQPLHAFDVDKVGGAEIVVRRARVGEKLRTLDGEDRVLTPEMLVIADNANPIALAGVMGGSDSEVTEGTTTLLLESAHFHPLAVRKTARLLGMRTEASFRFERTVDPDGALSAVDHACEWIAKLGCGDPTPGAIKSTGDLPAPVSLTLRPERASAMLGFPVSAAQCKDVLQKLGFRLTVGPSDTLYFIVPSWRTDVVREIDLVEEVGRVLGYDNIPETLPSGQSTQGCDSPGAEFNHEIRTLLCAAGLQEVVGHTFVAETNLEDAETTSLRVPVRSALSAELSGLRRDLLPGLMDVLDRNARRGASPLSFFEIGSVFHKVATGYAETTGLAGVICGPATAKHWDKASASRTVDFYTLRGVVDVLLDRLRVRDVTVIQSNDSRFHSGRRADLFVSGLKVGVIGELHPKLSANFNVRDRIYAFTLEVGPLMQASHAAELYEPLNQYPSVVRDVAPRIAVSVSAGQLLAAVRALNLQILESVQVTDVYSGPNLPENTKSITLQLVFRAADHTLLEDEVNSVLAKIHQSLIEYCAASFAT